MFSLSELANKFNATMLGEDCEINAVATLINAGSGDISFLSNTKYRKYLKECHASAVIISEQFTQDITGSALVVNNPYVVYARIAALLNPDQAVTSYIHPTSVVSDHADVHKDVYIGPQCVIEEGVKIAKGSYIGPGCIIQKNSILGECCRLVANVTICHGTLIGHRAILHPGAVIGGDGFGLANDNGVWIKIPQVGRAILGDDVEIGCNTTVDRGAIEDTEIANGVKLDNQIQVGHNVKIGEGVAVASSTAIAGSSVIGKNCTIAGLVGIAGHLEITDNVTVTGMTMVSKSIKTPGVYSSGIPCESNSKWNRNLIRIKQLDKMAIQLKELENATVKKI